MRETCFKWVVVAVAVPFVCFTFGFSVLLVLSWSQKLNRMVQFRRHVRYNAPNLFDSLWHNDKIACLLSYQSRYACMYIGEDAVVVLYSVHSSLVHYTIKRLYMQSVKELKNFHIVAYRDKERETMFSMNRQKMFCVDFGCFCLRCTNSKTQK